MGSDNDTNAEKHMNTVFLSGSRKLSRLNGAIKERLQAIIDQQLTVIIGDANGADKAMQSYLAQVGYPNVTVFFAGDTCRNVIGPWSAVRISVDSKLKGRAIHTEKDRAMAAKADFALVLWDRESIGSLTNVCEMVLLNKKAKVYVSPAQSFVSVSRAEDISALLEGCTPEEVSGFEAAPILGRHLRALGISAQSGFDF
ncbi:hypothetical protein KO498_04370 [Lentibacter algarum]|uniref:hypothetical protein n=1 Tax=Lentibacter algarum TaxID=576131 RepID=UPI001C07C0BA|nr:hypothetical protein [Lentibacter algarum]MBU2981042.1 hypothetical protein [Lentibacter algarum]